MTCGKAKKKNKPRFAECNEPAAIQGDDWHSPLCRRYLRPKWVPLRTLQVLLAERSRMKNYSPDPARYLLHCPILHLKKKKRSKKTLECHKSRDKEVARGGKITIDKQFSEFQISNAQTHDRCLVELRSNAMRQRKDLYQIGEYVRFLTASVASSIPRFLLPLLRIAKNENNR